MTMKSQVNMVKGKSGSRTSNQQAVFELKQRVVLALNKLGDRDTYQIGVEDLEKTIESLTHDGIAPFLSCILDTDSEKKCAVRKECIRIMGTLATFHEVHVAPHLSKMIGSIVKRLKDSDSAVRDACVETVGVLASKLSGNRTETDGVFVLLVRPLFEALGEQNKQVQSGSALCLSRVIDNIHDPPPMVLQKMLLRIVKLLKNPHFMAKPAAIELNRSIILAGGAASHSSLTAALTSIQEALKNSEWATRKAACAALGDIASCSEPFLGPFRSSSICSLESCRFDKVKPVRDAALHALQLWKTLPGFNTPEPSETGSSIKGASCRDEFDNITNASHSTLKDIKQIISANEVSKQRLPISTRTSGRNNIEKSQKSGTSDWQIEIAIPKNNSLLASENRNDESEISSVTKQCERIPANGRSINNIAHDCVDLDDKQECSSISTFMTESFKSKEISTHCDAFDDSDFLKSTGTSQCFGNDELSNERHSYLAKIHDRRSLDSTVTESISHTMNGCCFKTEKDLGLIRKQLLEIENKQSNLMDMLKAFATAITDNLSMVQLKMSNFELVVDRMARDPVQEGRYSDVLAPNVLKRSQNIVSPRLSTCTPRQSVDSNGHTSSVSTKPAKTWENTCSKSRSSSYGKQNLDLWSDATLQPCHSSLGKSTLSGYFPEIHEDRVRKSGKVFAPNPVNNARLIKEETKNSQWKVISGHISNGDLDTAYVEALCSGNEFILFELLDRTGPVLENLSQKTASDLLGTLVRYLLEQRFVNSIIPWFQQLVDLSNIHGPTYLSLSVILKRDLICAIQESAKADAFKTTDKKFLIELSKMLRHIWGHTHLL